MKKKIEKLKNNIYGDYPSERIEPPNNKQLMDKVNEIIERLNQEEPEKTKGEKWTWNRDEELSNCCGAVVHNPVNGIGRYSECKEMCSVEEPEEEKKEDFLKCSVCSTIVLTPDFLKKGLCKKCYAVIHESKDEEQPDNNTEEWKEDEFLNNYKIPCSCPKGGICGDGNGNGYQCSKCGGSEYIVDPKLIAFIEAEKLKSREEGRKAEESLTNEELGRIQLWGMDSLSFNGFATSDHKLVLRVNEIITNNKLKLEDKEQ